jgi:predicted metal-dependent hydrolase
MIVPDEIHRSKRKTLSISVDATGRLIVRAPLRCSEARIIAFIERKADWIARRQEKAKLVLDYLPNGELDGFSFSLLGRNCTIRKTKVKRVVYDDVLKVLYIPLESDEKTLSRWLKKYAKETFTQMTDVRAVEMGANYKAVAVSSAKTRWGSCSANNTLRFTFRLAYAPKEIIDYVVVHELAHTFHRNHEKAFWRTVEKYCPDWKVKRKWLKDHGYLMEIF